MTATDNVMKYVVGLAAAAAISLSGWSLMSTVGHEARIGIVEERSFNQQDSLNRIESQVNRLVDRLLDAREREHGTVSSAPRRRPVSDARETDDR